MNEDSDRIADAAATWHLASARDDMDWNGFTRWLEADPRHARAYDELALADDLALRTGRSAKPDRVEPQTRTTAHWPLWAGGAIAASLALFLAVGQLQGPSATVYASGETSREVVLVDGSQIDLAPGSQLTVGGRHRDELALEGNAYFAIRHDPARQLTVRAGGLEVTDIGTVFEIRTSDRSTRVAVAEGSVAVRGDALAGPVTIAAGKRFELDRAVPRASLSPIARSEVGEWRRGRLTFTNAQLEVVATDLARYARTKVVVPPSLADRRFSGTLAIGNGDTAVRDLAQLMGLEIVRDGADYRLEPAS